MRDLRDLATTISFYRLRFSTEVKLQADLAALFTAENIGFVREHALTAQDRPDFYLPLDRLAIECKVHGGLTPALKQCQRYAEHASVGGVLLVTRRCAHRIEDQELSGKPFAVCWIGGNNL